MTVKTVNNGIGVMNIALARLGEEEIQDVTSTTAGKLCGTLYRPLALSLLTGHPWKFAQKKKADTTVDSTPINEWKNAFSIAAVSDLLRIVAVYDSGDATARPMKEYERIGTDIYANVDEIWYDYIYDIAEENWPPWFVQLVAVALAAELAVPITDQVSKRDDLWREAYGLPSENGRGGLHGKAAYTDSIENPTKPLQQDQGEILTYRAS